MRFVALLCLSCAIYARLLEGLDNSIELFEGVTNLGASQVDRHKWNNDNDTRSARATARCLSAIIEAELGKWLSSKNLTERGGEDRQIRWKTEKSIGGGSLIERQKKKVVTVEREKEEAFLARGLDFLF